MRNEAVVRPSRAEDGNGLSRLIARCWADYPGSVYDRRGEMAALDDIQTYYEAIGGVHWSIIRDDKIVGCLGAAPIDSDVGIAWEMTKMYVSPLQRRSGFASLLVGLAEEHAGERHALGSITLAGGTFTVAMTGDIAPSTELHFDITQTAGPSVETLRLWIGDQSAKGSLKSKATAHNNYFHAHVESPVTLAMDSAFWMEAKNASGEREQASVALN